MVHCVCDNRMLQESPTSGIYGNDLMTPPEVLLEGVQKEAEKVTKEKSVVTRSNKIDFINIFSTLLTSVGCHSNYCLLHCLQLLCTIKYCSVVRCSREKRQSNTG